MGYTNRNNLTADPENSRLSLEESPSDGSLVIRPDSLGDIVIESGNQILIVGEYVAGTSTSGGGIATDIVFLPDPGFIDDEDDTYFYFGWDGGDDATDWIVRRITRETGDSQSATYSSNGAYATIAAAWAARASLVYSDASVLPPDVGGGGGGSGWIYVYDVVGQGSVVVSDKTWADTAENIIQSFTASGNDVTLRVRASHPNVLLGATPAQLPLVDQVFQGDLNLTLAGDGNITVSVVDGDGTTSATDTVGATVQAPPQILTLAFTGGYPGAQTELKAGDTFQLTGTTDRDADAIQLEDFGASGSVQTLTFASGTSFTITMTVGDRGTSTQSLAVRATARDASSGAYGPSFTSTNTVDLNNTYPSLSIGSITYPSTQSAIKASEGATVANTASDYDTIAYSDPTGTQLNISNASTFENPKTVSRVGGDFNNSTTNFRVTATRAANGAVSTEDGVVVIANVAPTISISTPAARLRSGGNNGTSAQNYTITLTSDQPLQATPTLNADSGGSRGTFIGSWAGGPSVYTRSLQVDETVPDEKGTFSFEGLVATGLSGLVQNSIDSGESYTLGGFVARSLTFAAFATTTEIGTEVTDFSKLTAGTFTATSGIASKQSIGASPPVTNGYTVDALSTNPTTLEWLDTTAASSNSGGTAQITNVEETV